MENYGTLKSPGPSHKLDDRTKRRIINEASNSTVGVRVLQRENAPNVSHMTVHRLLKNTPHLVRQRMKLFPMLKDEHKFARPTFAEKYIHNPGVWNQVPMIRLFYEYCVSRLFFPTKRNSLSMGPTDMHVTGEI